MSGIRIKLVVGKLWALAQLWAVYHFLLGRATLPVVAAQARSQVLRFGGKYILYGQDFCFYIHFSVQN